MNMRQIHIFIHFFQNCAKKKLDILWNKISMKLKRLSRVILALWNLVALSAEMHWDEALKNVHEHILWTAAENST